MFKLIESSTKKINYNEIDNDNIKNIYEYFYDNILVGYGIITNIENSKIYILIKKEYRNKGYGTKLFKEMLLIENKDTKVTCNNQIMRRIIGKYNGIEISRDEGYILYIIPKIK